LGRARRQPARTRQSQPAKSITKCRRLTTQLWFAPDHTTGLASASKDYLVEAWIASLRSQ
jgi:hypothetical protein